MIVAFEDEPFPKSPIGHSMSIKLCDWLDLGHLLPDVDLDVRAIRELGGDSPDIVEAFATREDLLGPHTFPTEDEHHVALDIRSYWHAVEQSGIPAIPVLPAGAIPEEFPVYVRGRTGSFARGVIRSRNEFQSMCTDTEVVVRPFVVIKSCGTRSSVTRELRVHVVCQRVVCVEFLFPTWAAQRPSTGEYAAGCAWTSDVTGDVVCWTQSLAPLLPCRWFTADFAETATGVQLVEINPGWCSGTTDPCSARAIHLAVLRRGFDLPVPETLWPQPVKCVPYVRIT